MNTFLKVALVACAVAGAAMSVSDTAHAQSAQCIVKDAGGKALLQMQSGQIVKFVAENDALLRNIKAQGIPQLLGKVASVELQPRCQAILYGNGGATWGHRRVQVSGSVGVPPAHVYGVKCECQ